MITRDLLLVEISRALRAASPDRAEDLIREAEKRIVCKAEVEQFDKDCHGHTTHRDLERGWEVWFKFGCAHVSRLVEGEQRDYFHACDVEAFIRFLSAAWAAPKNSVED